MSLELNSKYRYKGLHNWTSREVVSLHRNIETQEIEFYRHSAMKSFFLRIDNKWYLAIIPHHVYTSDGKTIYPYSEDLLSGIKRMELPSAVFGQTIMWKHKLTFIPRKTFYDSDLKEEPLISFGDLLRLTSERGLDDKSWRKEDITIEEDLDTWGLF